MKIICINTSNSATSTTAKPYYHLRPDTAMLRNNETFFVPEFASNLTAQFATVYKINRIAKAIEPKFAPRCYTQISTAVIFTAQNLIVQNQPWDMATAFDHSFAIAPLFVDATQNITPTATINNENVEVLNQQEDVNNTIAHLSDFMTLKIGDIIAIPFTDTINVDIDDTVKVWINDENKLQEFDVK